MRLRKFIATAIIFTHASAMSAESDCNIQSNGVQRQVAEFTDLVKPANIMSDTDDFGNADGRGTLTEKAGELGLTESDVKQIRQSTGYIVCPAPAGGNPAVMSAALVGSNMQIVTAAHAFYDFLGNARAPLAECYFRNQEVPYKMVKVDFDSPPVRIGATGPREASEPNEYAVVRLKEPIEGATPFGVDGTLLGKDESLISVAAHQKSPTREFPSEEPVVQQCRNRESRKVSGGPTQYYTDCDMSPLGSGGVLLTRSNGGALTVKGISVASGKEYLNGQPFDLSTSSYTRAIAINAQFATDVSEVRDSIPPRTASLKTN